MTANTALAQRRAVVSKVTAGDV